MPDWTFDAVNKLIIEPTGTGDTTYQMDRDIYSAWKREVQNGNLASVDSAFEVEGGTPIGATGKFTGTTQILVNNWKLRGAGYAHQVTIIGNAYSDDGVLVSPHPSAAVNIVLEQSAAAQGIATGSGLTAAQAAQVEEIHKRLDLESSRPNTYNNDNSQISNDDFSLTKTDNGDGTFTVIRS